ncbi:MAG: hypothetical protein NTY35_09525 [Planctomycetota bacterium]|nr:hypothetical protein [Planctomycetota bacterium]
MPNCTACGAPLETPVACAACGAVHDVPEGASPFDILGLVPSFVVDERDLRRRLTRCSRLVHPDFFGTAEAAVRERAERNSARLNQAFDVLSDAVRRADWLVLHLGGPTEENERAMPQAFLVEVLEWNEVLEESRAASGTDPRIAPLAAEIADRRAAGLARIAQLLDPLPERGSQQLGVARRELNALRYLDRALREVETLRLARAERR